MGAHWRERIAPWAGLIAGALGWSLHHQGMSDALHFGCDARVGMRVVLTGVLALIVAAGGGWISWRAAGTATLVGRQFVGRVAALSAGIFALAIALQVMAGLLVPACMR